MKKKENEMPTNEQQTEEEQRIKEEAKKKVEALKAEEAKKQAQVIKEEEKSKTEPVGEKVSTKIEEKNNQEEVTTKIEPTIPEETVKNEQQAPIQNDVSNPEAQQTDETSTFKRVMAVILFIAFFAIVYFLPEISDMITKFQESRKPKQIITDGVSTCTLSRTSENLDINTTAKFSIINSKLYKLEYVTATTGDKIEDEEELNKLNETCKSLKKAAGELNGVVISCNLNNGTNTAKQTLDLEKVDAKEVSAAYAEAGGIYPEFKKNDNIDKIEAKMKSSGYECTRS